MADCAVPTFGHSAALERSSEAEIGSTSISRDIKALYRRVSLNTALENGFNHSFVKILGMRHPSCLRHAVRNMNQKQTQIGKLFLFIPLEDHSNR